MERWHHPRCQNGIMSVRQIELLTEEQDHIDSKRESRVSMIIAVFGFVSIVAAALQILDYLSSGRGVMIGGFVGAVSGILGISLFLYIKKGD